MVPRLRILCADDNADVLRFLGDLLSSGGHEVETAMDGEEALEQLLGNPCPFDLLVTDSQMPRLDGFGLVDRARAAGFKGDMIVFASPLSDEERWRYRQLGVEKIIEKPAHAALLAAVKER